MSLFTFSGNTKPPVSEIWTTLLEAEIFDSLAEPTTARTIVWALLASTTNFPATKAEINKFVEGKTDFSSIENGFTQSVSAKYGIALHHKGLKDLRHQDAIPTPEMIKVPYIRLMQMFDKSIDNQSAVKFMQATVQDLFDETTEGHFLGYIWGGLVVSAWSIQTRFPEYLKDFRIYFPASADGSPRAVTQLQDEEALITLLQEGLLRSLIDNGRHTFKLHNTYKVGE